MTVPQKYKINFLLCKRSLHFYLWTHKRRFPLELALLLLCILQCLFSCTLRWCALFNISALTLSWRRLFSYRNQSIDLQSKSMDWFLYDNGLRLERVKCLRKIHSFNHSGQRFFQQLKVTMATSRVNQRNFSQNNSFSWKRS